MTNTIENKPRCGRARKLTARAVRHLRKLVLKDRRASASHLSEEVSTAVGVKISAQTVRRTLHEMNLHGRRPRRKPLLKQRHKTARMEFAESHTNETEGYWQNILWSDETKINLFGSDGVQHVWREVGEDYHQDCVVPTVKHGGGSVLVWGCMSSSGVGEMTFIDGIMNARVYVDILQTFMLSSLKKLGRRGIFMQDNDPKHTARVTKEFLHSKKVKTMEWPSMSPDLNPIEHLWGILKRKVEERNPSSKEQLKKIISDEWKKISPDVCSKLVSSMPRRIKAVIENKGGHTKY